MKIAKLQEVRLARKIRRLYRRALRPFTGWWRRYDRRWHWWWRAANLLALAIVVAGIVLPVVNTILTNDSYKLSPAARQLVGTSDPKLAKQLAWNAQEQAWHFNAKGVVSGANLPGGAGAASALAAMRAQVGTPSGQGKDTSTYALTLPQDLSQGITYTDTNTQLSFSLVPEFKTHAGRMVDGHIVYPLPGGMQAIYTLKNNGLKEDIFVPASHQPTLSFGFKLKLPGTLAARALPGGSGGIGIYSADPSLYGTVTYGSSSDQQAVMRARRTAQKNNLVFALPAPVITAPRGVSLGSSTSRFEQSQSELTVIAEDLNSLTAPLSIDPSVVVTSASDFSNGNNEDNISFGTSGQITRGGLTGGSVSAGWQTTTSFSTGRQNFGAAAYNGYLYVVGGVGTGFYSDVQYAPINANGTVGTWQTTTSLPGARSVFGIAAYSGYLYVVGGKDGSSNYVSTVLYAPINSNGTVGTWGSTTSLSAPRGYLGTVAYNNFLYILGGTNSTNFYNDVQYAPINANGTVGTWQTTSSFNTVRYGLGSVAYNGFLYVMGGYDSSANYRNDVQYAPINANGTVGTWQTTSSFTNGRYSFGAVVNNGYLYVLGGYGPGGGGNLNDVQYASINSNGSVGTWRTSSSFATARYGLGAVANNGYLYVLGGNTGTAYFSDVQYAKIDPAGVTSNWNPTSTSFSQRSSSSSVSYHGYLYLMGGSLASDTSYMNDVQYAPINANGTIGTWQYTYNSGSSTSFSGGFYNARIALNAVVYNGYMYILGGEDSSNLLYNDVQYAPINANGTIGTWQYTYNSGSSTSFSGGFYNARSYFGAIAYGGYLYVAGGSGNGGNLNDVQYAPINANGTIGTWQTTNSFTTARSQFAAVAYNGYLYVLGGYGSSGSLNDVQYAPINANGTVGTWASMNSNFPSLYSFTSITSNGYIYAVGGGGSSGFNTVQYAQINNGGPGTAGAWTTSANAFTYARSNHQTVAYNGYLYVMGGTDPTVACTGSGGSCADVQYAPINRDGSIGTWQATSSFTTGRSVFGAVAYNGYLYVMGGEAGGGTVLSDIQYAHINATGSVGTWTTSSHTLTGRYGLTASAAGGYVYVMGGCTTISLGTCSAITGSVQYAALSPTDGSVGTWAAATSLPAARYSPESVTYGGYLYIMGGCTTYANTNNLCNAYTNDVSYAPINTNGTLGTWQTTSGFTTGRYLFGATAYNGYIYLYGGSSASNGYMNDAQYAAINTNGTLGTWQATSGFTTGRFGLGSATYNGYLYLTGGCTGNALNCGSGLAKADTQYAPLQSIARTGHYSKLIDLGSAVNVSGVTFNGTSGGGVSVNYRAAGADGVFGSAAPASSISGSGCTSNVASMRYIFLTVTLDDSYGQSTGGGFPDSASTAANLTDLTVNYSSGHPPPNIRLRAGQTLQQGSLSPLDTCS